MTTHHPPPRSPPTTPPTSTTTAMPSHPSIPYSSTFTQSLTTCLLSSTSPYGITKHHTGIRVLPSHPSSPPSSTSAPIPRISLPLSSVQEASIAQIDMGDLPLALEDSRRIYASDIPGVLLTHPGGYYEGGPCTDPSVPPPSSTEMQPSSSPYHSFVQSFLLRHPDLTSTSDLQRAIKEETDVQLEVLRARMREREDGRLRNVEVERKIEALVKDREVERKVEERWNRGGRASG